MRQTPSLAPSRPSPDSAAWRSPPSVSSVASPVARAETPHYDLVSFQRNVDPASARYLTDAIDAVQSDGAALLLIALGHSRR